MATLREARYRGRAHGEPDPVAAALDCEAAGAHGITAHLREDRRHMRTRTGMSGSCARRIKTRLNLEMANVPEIIAIASRVKPEGLPGAGTTVEVTTEGGLEVAGNVQSLSETRKRMNDAGIEVSCSSRPTRRKLKPRRARAASSSSSTPALSMRGSRRRRTASLSWNA